jgi:small-conductance mechanosensitive channel
MRRTLATIGLLLLLPAAVNAQAQYDATRLTQLYQAKLDAGETSSEYVDTRIVTERERIREQATEEVAALIAKETDPETVTEGTALDRQRALVSVLEEERKDRQVDIDLLDEEERRFYTGQPLIGTGSTETLRQTATHAELLAKRAILEERIAVLEEHLELQKDRESKLARDVTLQQFGTLIELLKYIGIVLGAVLIDRLIRKRLARKLMTNERRYFFIKVSTFTIYGMVFLWLFSMLIADHPGVLASLAIIGAGIAVALQDLIKDMVSWVIILQRRLYTLGQRISIGQFTGDVIDISPLRTTMLEVGWHAGFAAHERTGKTLTMPNSMILREPVLNYHSTSDFMAVEMQITITSESDWKSADRILQELLKEHVFSYAEQARAQQKWRTAQYYTKWEVSEPAVHMDLGANGLIFTLKFTAPIGMRRDVVTLLSKSIVERFGAAGIRLAYSTMRVVQD